jgi:hypothetical protein
MIDDNNLKKNELEKVRQRLYKSNEEIDDTKKRVEIPRERIETPAPYWQEPQESSKLKKIKKIFIWLSIGLIFVFLGLAAYFFFSGSNIISSGNIDLEVTAPSYIEAGKQFSLNISIQNKNQASLETADLIVNFPEGVFSPSGDQIKKTRISLGKVNSGETINKNFDIVLLGLDNEDKKIPITLEYRLSDSNAIFSKDGDYTIKISRPALGISIAMPKDLNTRQEISLNVDIVSNSDTIIKNSYLSINYPPGFQFKSSNPAPTTSQNLWAMGDLIALQKKTIEIKGVIDGTDMEEKVFNASAGILGEDGVIKSYGTSFESAVVKKTALGIIIFINNEDIQKNVFKAGKTVRGTIMWQNNFSSPVRDASIEMTINGFAIDEGSISVNGGSYRSSDKKIIWNSSSLPDLSNIGVGETGEARFSFTIKDTLPIATADDKNFSVNLDAKVMGMATSDQSQNLILSSEVKKEIIIASDLEIFASALYHSGAFKNTGPLPPKIGNETTYTINWSLSGNSNDLTNVKVTTSLPSYVRWLNVVSPKGENISFDDKNGTVVWNIDKLFAGTGIVSPKKEVSFQIGFVPGLNQEGLLPTLITESAVSAFDDFIKDYLSVKISSLNTHLGSDPGFNNKEGKVIK